MDLPGRGRLLDAWTIGETRRPAEVLRSGNRNGTRASNRLQPIIGEGEWAAVEHGGRGRRVEEGIGVPREVADWCGRADFRAAIGFMHQRRWSADALYDASAARSFRSAGSIRQLPTVCKKSAKPKHSPIGSRAGAVVREVVVLSVSRVSPFVPV